MGVGTSRVAASPRRTGRLHGYGGTGVAIVVGAVAWAVPAAASPGMIPLMVVPLLAVGWLVRGRRPRPAAPAGDPVTGLPDRRALVAGLAERLARVPSTPAAVIVVDLDRFHEVNDGLGYAAGDRLLIQVAQRLRAAVRTDDTVARIGGDEFAVLASYLPDASAARAVAERIAAALAEPVILDGLSVDVSAAIGVAVHPEHGTDATTLIRCADVARYDAKHLGSPIEVYSTEADPNSRERLELLADLRRAVVAPASDGLSIYYQPQVELRSGEVVGVEALLRWNDARRGQVDPEELIRVVEPTTVMRLLTGRVIDDVVAQLAAWRAHGLTVRASVNVSSRDLLAGEMVERLADRLREHGVAAGQIQLELTESAVMTDSRRALVTLHQLAGLGVALSLDDFGTGYSSLQHLRRLPLAEVKIDRSFVLGMAAHATDAVIVESIVGLGRALELRVVAEGVENDQTRRLLDAAGCEVVQGWYYARPMPAEEFLGWLNRYRAVPLTSHPQPCTPDVPAPTQAGSIPAGTPGSPASRRGADSPHSPPR